MKLLPFSYSGRRLAGKQPETAMWIYRKNKLKTDLLLLFCKQAELRLYQIN